MEHNKYKELKGMIAALDEKFSSMDRLVRGSLLVLKDYDAQITTMKDLLFAAGALVEEEYNTQVDTRRGLRLLNPGEQIGAGDIVWVNYKATANPDGNGEQIVAEDEQFVVRVGSGAVTFEQTLVGKATSEEVTHVQLIQDEGPLNGKEITFNIQITKAKTQIKEETQDAGTGATTGFAGATPDDTSGTEAGGPGNEEPNAGTDTTVQAGRSDGVSEGSHASGTSSTDSDGNGGGISGTTEDGDSHDSLPQTMKNSNGAFQNEHTEQRI